MMRLREPFKKVPGRKFRVIVYGRYSTEEQNYDSVEHQYDYCTRFLANHGLADSDVSITFLEDREISGEVLSRPGIDAIWAAIDKRGFDLLVAEDSSRLYRNESACMRLGETIVDQGIRLICINDYVDSAERAWHDRFSEAAHHHAKSNAFVSARIKRAQEAHFRGGAAMGCLLPGYKRRATHEATAREPERGPFYDSPDEDEFPVIVEAYDRVGAGEPLWSVALFLNDAGLRKCATARSNVWTDRDVRALIQRTVHRGVESYRATTTDKKWVTGKKGSKKNDPEDVLTRSVPHLRIVDDPRWVRANQEIANGSTGGKPPSGDDNPLKGVPRDSRFPLSKLLVCGKCGGKMWQFGAKNRYRCSNTRGKFLNADGRWEKVCDNGAGAPKDLAHRRISAAVIQELLGLTGVAETLVATIASRLADDEPRQREVRDLRKREADLRTKCLRLVEQIEDGRPGASPPETLTDRLRQREQELAVVRTDLQRLEAHPAAMLRVTPEEIRQRIDEYADRLLVLDRRSGPLLEQLIDGKIRAVRYQQFGCSTVVLKAEFDFQPVGILPESLRAALSGAETHAVATLLPKKRIVLDLFDPTQVPANAMKALALKEDNPKLTEEAIAAALDITHAIAHRSVKFGRKLRAAGLEESYIRLDD
ncbi:MAG TPA: recombinase family protein [Pirellulaceae bacterium]|jgi:DNA invertase Pin-like site-specific DNA recombinase|nr:recombinase family protein [Pirellulaceae bacterium]